MSDLEEEAQSSQATAHQASQTHIRSWKNWMIWKTAHHNNLRIVGLPETYNSGLLTELCNTHIPGALGINKPCIVERAHRVGAPSNDRSTPPPNNQYLNYSDRVALLKSFQNANSFQLEGHKLLIFADYSQEVSCKQKAFQPICSALHLKGVKFTLAYPIILHLTDTAGETKSFSHPHEHPT